MKIWSTVVGEPKELGENVVPRDKNNCRKHYAPRLEDQREGAGFSESRSLERPHRAGVQPLPVLLSAH